MTIASSSLRISDIISIFFRLEILLVIGHGPLQIHGALLQIRFQIASLFFFQQRAFFVEVALQALEVLPLFLDIGLGFFHLGLKSFLGPFSRLRFRNHSLNIDKADFYPFLRER